MRVGTEADIDGSSSNVSERNRNQKIFKFSALTSTYRPVNIRSTSKTCFKSANLFFLSIGWASNFL